MLENMEGAIKIAQSRETGNTEKLAIQRNWQYRAHNTKKNTTQYMLDTSICKQTQIMYIRHEPSYKQLEVKKNQTPFLCFGKCYSHI